MMRGEGKGEQVEGEEAQEEEEGKERKRGEERDTGQQGIDPSTPGSSSHRTEDRCPRIGFDVRSPVLIEAFSRATVFPVDP